MEVPKSKSFTYQRKLNFQLSIELLKEHQPLTMERYLSKLQIEIGMSEDLAQKTIKNMITDKRIICKEGLVNINETPD